VQTAYRPRPNSFSATSQKEIDPEAVAVSDSGLATVLLSNGGADVLKMIQDDLVRKFNTFSRQGPSFSKMI
jgi:hypothetical protein